MKNTLTMNFTLLDSMIRPLTQDRPHQCDEDQHCRIASPGSGKNRLPPGQSMVVRAGSICQSKSIPISNIKRNLSEVQLHEDEAMADYRDYCFYARLVNGISHRQEGSIGNHHCHRPADPSLANIIRTRNLPVTPEAYSSSEPQACSFTTGTADPEVQARRQSFLGGTELLDDDQEEIFILDMWWIKNLIFLQILSHPHSHFPSASYVTTYRTHYTNYKQLWSISLLQSIIAKR